MGFTNKRRDIVLCVLFTIFSLGIYAIYWLYIVTEEANALSENENNYAGGGLTIVFAIITFGVYLWYWAYKMGERIQVARQKRNMPACSNDGLIYMILSIIQLDFIGLMLMQHELNKFQLGPSGAATM